MTKDISDMVGEVANLKHLIIILYLALNNEKSGTDYYYDEFMNIIMSKIDTLLEHLNDFNLELFKKRKGF